MSVPAIAVLVPSYMLPGSDSLLGNKYSGGSQEEQLRQIAHIYALACIYNRDAYKMRCDAQLLDLKLKASVGDVLGISGTAQTITKLQRQYFDIRDNWTNWYRQEIASRLNTTISQIAVDQG